MINVAATAHIEYKYDLGFAGSFHRTAVEWNLHKFTGLDCVGFCLSVEASSTPWTVKRVDRTHNIQILEMLRPSVMIARLAEPRSRNVRSTELNEPPSEQYNSSSNDRADPWKILPGKLVEISRRGA